MPVKQVRTARGPQRGHEGSPPPTIPPPATPRAYTHARRLLRTPWETPPLHAPDTFSTDERQLSAKGSSARPVGDSTGPEGSPARPGGDSTGMDALVLGLVEGAVVGLLGAAGEDGMVRDGRGDGLGRRLDGRTAGWRGGEILWGEDSYIHPPAWGGESCRQAGHPFSPPRAPGRPYTIGLQRRISAGRRVGRVGRGGEGAPRRTPSHRSHPPRTGEGRGGDRAGRQGRGGDGQPAGTTPRIRRSRTVGG